MGLLIPNNASANIGSLAAWHPSLQWVDSDESKRDDEYASKLNKRLQQFDPHLRLARHSEPPYFYAVVKSFGDDQQKMPMLVLRWVDEDADGNVIAARPLSEALIDDVLSRHNSYGGGTTFDQWLEAQDKMEAEFEAEQRAEARDIAEQHWSWLRKTGQVLDPSVSMHVTARERKRRGGTP